MPTQRAHRGAPLYPVPLVTPGYFGLNKQEASSILPPQWATELDNAVIDDTGRIGARKGFLSLTSTPVSLAIVQTFEFIKASGLSEQISSTDDDIYTGINAPTSIDGGLTITDGNWKFVNFVEKCIGFQEGKTPIVYTGTGDFVEIAVDVDGTIPKGGIGVAAFGRLWVTTADNKDIRYCDILDETIWDDATLPGDSGTIAMQRFWPSGQDYITAIAAHNGLLVVFGTSQIVIFSDEGNTSGMFGPEDENMGLVPSVMYASDTIGRVGCIARDSVQHVKEDLWFLSDYGIQSLGRLVQEKSAPLDTISRAVQDYLLSYVSLNYPNLDKIRSVYSPKDRLYLLSFPPSLTSGSNKTFVFDTRGFTERGEARATTWGFGAAALSTTRDQKLYICRDDVQGEIGEYTGYTDDGAMYKMVYESGWMDLDPQQEGLAPLLKILKRIRALVNVPSATTITFKWWWDFSTSAQSSSATILGDATSEWSDTITTASGQWNDAFISGGESVLDDQSEWGGGLSLNEISVPAGGTGKYLKVGLTMDVNGSHLGVQQIDLAVKLGRIK